jgi:hypothetical protein
VFACWNVAYENPAVKLPHRSAALNIVTENTPSTSAEWSEYCSDNDAGLCLVFINERLVFVKQIGTKMESPANVLVGPQTKIK